MGYLQTTSSTSTTYFVGGPCRECSHDQDEHGVVCDSEDCPDDAPMCLLCIAELPISTPHPAFHEYVRSPLEMG